MKPLPAQIPFSLRAAGLRRWGVAHPFWYYTAPLVAWVLFITWASLTTPGNLPDFHIPFADKFEHTGCYAILGVLMLRGWARGLWPRPAAWLAVALVAPAWGLYLEFMQLLCGYRTFDWYDALANTIGTLSGMVFWFVLLRGLNVAPLPPPGARAVPFNRSFFPHSR